MRPVAPPAVRWITRTLEEAGHETWAVGGAVRDACMGHPSDDWDLATRATPKQVRRIFRRTVPIGIDHGTVGVLARDGTLYEVTTFRRDVETDGRHAVVSFADTLQEDLARRDFTINAIAWHATREELCDPFGGVRDLEAGVLRTVGAPEERFAEDYLRILRALRFAGRFGLEIEARTWRVLSASVGALPRLSAERLREELIKVLDQDPDPTRALDLYATSGVLGVLYPELERLRAVVPSGHLTGPDMDAWTLAVATVAELPKGRPYLRLAGLLRGLSLTEAAALLMRLRLSNAQVDEIARRAAAAPLPGAGLDDAVVRRWLSEHGVERLSAVARLELAKARAESRLGFADRTADVVVGWRRARAVRATAPPLTVGDLEIDGRDLISMGLRPGPEFGTILEGLLHWVLEDPTRNVRDELVERVREGRLAG